MESDRERRIQDGLLRYNAMTDALQCVPAGVKRRGEADRIAFGDIYLYRDAVDGGIRWSPLHVLRFLVEVCGLTYAEARAGVIAEMSRFTSADALPEPKTLAGKYSP